ncbi:hypothetical protein PFISCL1PPCAC_23438, partial [Pristionchus fissidentatus]
MPVFDARTANGQVAPADTLAYGGITILSAEPFYNLYAFKMRILTFMQFATCGYDAFLNDYQVMKIETPDYGPATFVTISSPILTLYTESFSVNTKFTFYLDKENKFGAHNLATPSHVSVMSPGWLNSTHSFPYEYPIDAFGNNSFKFAENRVLMIKVSATGFLPGDNLLIQTGTYDDQTY